jgi:hypothetical protein
VARQQLDLLAQLERDVPDRAVPLADLLRTCLIMAGQTQAAQLRSWASGELNGYPRRDSVPEYRVVVAPIYWDVEVPYRGVFTRQVNIQDLPDFVREHINEMVPLNQSVDELEELATRFTAQNEPVPLGVIGGDLYTEMWSRTNGSGQRAIRMYWCLDPAVIRGVLGRVRTALTEFVVELRTEVGYSDQLPSAAQTDEAFRAAVPSAVFNNSNVTIMNTKNGDIMPDAPRTTIKGNKTTIKDSKGTFSVASAHVAQVNGDGINVEKIREFADLIGQIAPALGLGSEQRADLESGADELQAAANDPAADRGRFRLALDGVLRLLRAAGPTAAQRLAISMGDDLIRELGTEIIRELPR